MNIGDHSVERGSHELMHLHPVFALDEMRRITVTAENRLKLVARNQAGDVRYTFADPYKCRCLYVGGAKEYSAYQRLVREKQIEQEPPLDGEPTDGLWGPLDSQ